MTLVPCIDCMRYFTKNSGSRCLVCQREHDRKRNSTLTRQAYRDPQYRKYPVNGRLCWLCHELIGTGQGTRDHVVPLSAGGTNDWANLRPAHRRCNSKRGNRTREDD